jgi:hypothetical protein
VPHLTFKNPYFIEVHSAGLKLENTPRWTEMYSQFYIGVMLGK